MSLDLGCFAECLRCELCPKPGDDELDLSLPDDYDDFDDPIQPDDWTPPEEESDDPWEGWETPGVDLPGGGRATPDWNDGPGIELEWPWG